MSIIEKKRCNFQATIEKNKAWDAIYSQFQSRFGSRRDLCDLREQWTRMKLQAKVEWSSHKMSVRQTGGGPPSPNPSPMCMLIRDLIPHDVLQIRNPFDDDVDSSQQNEEAVTVLEFLAGESIPFQECIIVVLKKRINVVSDMVLQSPSL